MISKLFECGVYGVFSIGTAGKRKLKFHESTTYILRPENFYFKLPVVLKPDFKRRNNPLSCYKCLCTLGHVPVCDFCLSILSILHYTKSLKILSIMKIAKIFNFNSNCESYHLDCVELTTLSA